MVHTLTYTTVDYCRRERSSPCCPDGQPTSVENLRSELKYHAALQEDTKLTTQNAASVLCTKIMTGDQYFPSLDKIRPQPIWLIRENGIPKFSKWLQSLSFLLQVFAYISICSSCQHLSRRVVFQKNSSLSTICLYSKIS